MSVRERLRVLEGAGHSQVINEQQPALPPRPRPPVPAQASGHAPPDPARNEECEPTPTLPPRLQAPALALERARPPVPPKSKSLSGHLATVSRSIGSGPPDSISLVDIDEDASDETLPNQLTLLHPEPLPPDPDAALLTEPARDNVRRRSPSPLANGINKLRVGAPKVLRTVSDSTQQAFGNVQKQAPKAFQGVTKGAQKTFVNVQTGTQKAFQTPAWESTVKGTQRIIKDVHSGIRRTINGIPVPQVFAQTAEDFSDLAGLAAGKPGICSRCATMPVGACFRTSGEVQEEYLSWASPLSRIALHAKWCTLCHILLSM